MPGPKMLAVECYVADHPGCTKLAAGRAAWSSGFEGNMGYLYGPVNRAIKAGLVRAEFDGHKYSLTIPRVD